MVQIAYTLLSSISWSITLEEDFGFTSGSENPNKDNLLDLKIH